MNRAHELPAGHVERASEECDELRLSESSRLASSRSERVHEWDELCATLWR